MTDRELMQMALDALEKHVLEYETAEALRARLAQPEPQQYVDVFHVRTAMGVETIASAPYTKPAKKEWVSLTDEEIISSPYCAGESDSEVIRLARDIEAKLKEKNI